MKLYHNVLKSNRVLNLQQFNDEGNEGQGNEGGSDEATPEVPTFKTYEEYQSHLDSEKDKHTQKAINTAKQKWEADKQQAIDDAKSEAEKYGQMTAEQKAQADLQKKIDDLTKKETELNKRELKSTAMDTFSEKGLPPSLANIMQFTDAESCVTHVDIIEKAFREAVEAETEKRLASSVDVPGGGGNAAKGNEKAETGERIAKGNQAKVSTNPYFKHN